MSLPLPGGSWSIWGRSLVRALDQRLDRLSFLRSDSSAANDGAIMWDAANGHPVVSKDGAWAQIVVANGYASLIQDADITAASADTAYSITFDDPVSGSGVTRSGSQIALAESGLYEVEFRAQIMSITSSTVTFRVWLAKNGADIADSLIMAQLHQNNATLPINATALIDVNASDYIEVKWATDSTSGKLAAHASTAYSPASASAALVITRVHA